MAVPLLPLVLSAKYKAWRGGDLHDLEADAEFQSVRKKALERDRYCCRFCGFEQKPSVATPHANFYMQVHHKDDDHGNNGLANLVTACMHCHAVQHIGLYGSKHKAKLIWLPEMSQADLHHLLRACLVAKRYRQTLPETTQPDKVKAAQDLVNSADATLGLLTERRTDAKDRYKTDDPSVIANFFVAAETPLEVYMRRGVAMQGARLLLAETHMVRGADIMPVVVDSWLAPGGAFAGMKPNVWAQLGRAA